MKVEYNAQDNIAYVFPDGPLSQLDFAEAAATIDPAIEKQGQLNGLIIATESFPGWESFSALIHHLRFVHDHHKAVRRVALVTDSVLGTVAEKIAAHFVSAEIRHFSGQELAGAETWILCD